MKRIKNSSLNKLGMTLSNAEGSEFRIQNLHWPIIGHEKAISNLQAQINNQRLNHAYLFSGPAQIGKFRLAKIFAQNILCENKNSAPCQKCTTCVKVNSNSHPDVIIIQPERAAKTAKTSIAISDVRTMIRKLNLTSHSSEYKIAIIDQAHNLGAEAANALLKTLEEPPKNSIIILITDQEKMLLPTITSRLQKISLKTLTANEVQQELEKRGLNSDQAEVLAQITCGKIGQAIELSSDEKIARYSASIEKLIKAKDQDKFNRIKLVDQIAINLDDLPQILIWWTYFFRNIMQTKLSVKKNHVDTNTQFFIDVYDLKKINIILKKLTQARKLLSQNINPKLLLENLLLEI